MPPAQVIIPAFRPAPGQLEAAVESALAAPNVESVLVVDDGSEPAVRGWLGERRVRLIRQANQGPSAARNRGIEEATAEFLLFLDHDDWLEEGGLREALCLGQDFSAAAVLSARYEQRGSERRLKEAPPEWAGSVLPSRGDVFRPLAIFGASGLLVRRAALGVSVRFDPQLWVGEDRDFLRRLADVGPIAVNPTPLLTVRLHEEGDNLTSTRHLERRVRDHLVILRRHHSEESDEPLRQQTIWLLNALARQRPLNRELWEMLRDAAAGYGWSIPLKSRMRAWSGRVAGV